MVEEDRPPIYDTDTEEEYPPVFELNDDNDKYPIFDIYVVETHPPCDLLVLEMPPMLVAIKATAKATTEVSNMAIKVNTIATKPTLAVHSPEARLGPTCSLKDATLKDSNKSATREDTWPTWNTPAGHRRQFQHPLKLVFRSAHRNLKLSCSCRPHIAKKTVDCRCLGSHAQGSRHYHDHEGAALG